MKKYTTITCITAYISLVLWSCEGPMGPTGPAGQDINETCKTCHSNESGISIKTQQASHSKHATGEAWLQSTRNDCAPCHSHEGFHDVIKNTTPKQKYIASAEAIASQSQISCGTCHKIHTNFDLSDFGLTFDGPVDMLIDTSRTRTLIANLGNKGNLCIKCHQPRIIKQMNYTGAPTDTYTGITYRFGPHYGTVGSIFSGKGAFEITGTLSYNNSQHSTSSSCITCHMANQNGLAGGHTFFARNKQTGAINTKGCVDCHTNSTALTTLITSTQTEIKGLLNQLGAKLDQIGGANGGILEKDGDDQYTGYVDIYDASSNADAKYKTSSQTVALPNFPTINNIQAAAIVNFQLVLRDKSMGIHNYAYTKALLQNSIDAL